MAAVDWWCHRAVDAKVYAGWTKFWPSLVGFEVLAHHEITGLPCLLAWTLIKSNLRCVGLLGEFRTRGTTSGSGGEPG